MVAAKVMPRSPRSTQAEPSAGLRSSALMPLASTMRPRSIGTRSSAPCGACSRTKASKRPVSAEGMSRKKNDGACAGNAAANCRCRLPSISMTVTSNDRPRPSESTTLGVNAPRRWMLAMASRNSVERMCGRRRAIAIVSIATSHSATKRTAAAPTKIAARRRSYANSTASPARAPTMSAVATT